MKSFIRNILMKLSRESIIPKLSRQEARKELIEFIRPILKSEGFLHEKGTRFWRIQEQKTDVIEIRFFNDTSIPTSTFSLFAGCYFSFIPSPFDKKIINLMTGKLTPDEAHCHLRIRGKRSYSQHALIKHSDCWHFDCVQNEKDQVLDDVKSVLLNQFFPFINTYKDANDFLVLLEQKDCDDFYLGNYESFNRQFLLAFTYMKLGDLKLAKVHLLAAKKWHAENDLLLGMTSYLSDNSPLLNQAQIVLKALEQVGS